MCGICGFAGNPENVDRLSMLAALSHRGPDDTGEHCEEIQWGKLWLGHKRLSILDLSPAGHQPMAYADGRLWITFNGEIYNFHDIRRELGRARLRLLDPCRHGGRARRLAQMGA